MTFLLAPNSSECDHNCRLPQKDLRQVESNPLTRRSLLQINPQQLVPCLVDGDFVMNESRAIVAYLVNAFGSQHQELYPTDPKIRARIDQRMYFEIGTFYPAFADCCVSVWLVCDGLDAENTSIRLWSWTPNEIILMRLNWTSLFNIRNWVKSSSIDTVENTSYRDRVSNPRLDLAWASSL